MFKTFVKTWEDKWFTFIFVTLLLMLLLSQLLVFYLLPPPLVMLLPLPHPHLHFQWPTVTLMMDSNSNDWHLIVQPLESLMALTLCVPGPAALISLGSSLQVHLPGPRRRPMASEALGLGARNLYLLTLQVVKLSSAEKATQVPENRQEGWERTEAKHLEPPPAGVTLSVSGRLPTARRKWRKPRAGFQNVVTQPLAFGSRPVWEEAPPELSPDAAGLFPQESENDKTPDFSWMQAHLIKLATVSNEYFLRCEVYVFQGLLDPCSHWIKTSEGCNKLSNDNSSVSSLRHVLLFCLTWHLAWDKVSRFIC